MVISLSLYIFLYVYVYIYIYISTNVYTYICVYACVYLIYTMWVQSTVDTNFVQQAKLKHRSCISISIHGQVFVALCK